MAKAPITKRTVDAAKPEKVDYVIWDDGGKETIKGFGLKVTPNGGKVYVYQYRIARAGMAAQTSPRKYTIGKHGELTPDQARIRARELAAMVTQGIDPRQRELDAIAAQDEANRRAEEKARLDAELSFDLMADKWLDEYSYRNGQPRSGRSIEQARSVIKTHLRPKLGNLPLPAITPANLRSIINAIPSRRVATRRTVFAYASILFGWAHKRGDIAENPLRAIAKPDAPTARDRVLTDEELAVIWQATLALRAPLGPFYRILVLTGQRREEVASMDWAELDRDNAIWTIPAVRAKNGTTHIVPLSDAVLDEIDRLALLCQVKDEISEPGTKRWPKAGPVISVRGYVSLSSFSQAKKLLDAEIAKIRVDNLPMTSWRVHDLRRTLATGFQRLGVRFEVTESVLNHLSGAKGGVAGIYQRHDWATEKRSALDAWARHVATIIAPASKEGGNVVPLHQRHSIS